MRYHLLSFLLTALVGYSVSVYSSGVIDSFDGPKKLIQVDSLVCPDLYMWTDVCNVYLLRKGDAALLIDLGKGNVLEYLKQEGVNTIEWVLFTHHHREQCQGYPLLADSDTRIAVPERERSFFENPSSFRKMNPALKDQFTIHGASYIRPPVNPVKVHRTFARMDTFTWHDHEIRCIETKGNSPGAMSYFLKTSKGWIVFSGDLMMNGARMHNWFDTEWDYGFSAGLYAMHNSAAFIADFDPVMLLPSHGPVIRDVAEQLDDYQEKLRTATDLMIRGYQLPYSASIQDKISKPTPVPDIWQTLPHLYKFKGPRFSTNFNLILADNGHALAVDCGLFDETFLEIHLDMMSDRLGLKQIDAVIITHMHGDHFLQVPLLKNKYGTEVWALDRMVPQIEQPGNHHYAAMINAYDKGFNSLEVDRTLHEGEKIQWQGYEFTVDWMPGQTEFAMCMHGMIDSTLVAFTGDNIFGDPEDPSHEGNEALVSRNSSILEEGYIYAAEYLNCLQPDLIVGGHSFIMDDPAGLIQRYHDWSYKMRDALRDLSSLDDYRYWYNPYWVKAEPYRKQIRPGETVEIKVLVRNFRERKQTHRIGIHTPPGVTAYPNVLECNVRENAQESFPVTLTASGDATAGVHLVAFDITIDEQAFGEWFDFIINIAE